MDQSVLVTDRQRALFKLLVEEGAAEGSTDGPEGEQGAGYIWNAVLRAHRSVRNYGFFEDLVRYEAPAALGGIAPLRNPASTNTQVAFPAEPALLP